jgi:hypothetical protein
MKGRKHTPEQIVRKLREGERLLPRADVLVRRRPWVRFPPWAPHHLGLRAATVVGAQARSLVLIILD